MTLLLLAYLGIAATQLLSNIMVTHVEGLPINLKLRVKILILAALWPLALITTLWKSTPRR